MSAPSAPESVLYRFWPHADPPRLEFLSARAEDVLEATAAEVAAMLAAGTVPLVGVDVPGFYAGLDQSTRDHAPWQAEFGYVGPRTGRERWFQAAEFPQTAADGTRYFLGTLLDVSDRRASETAERESADSRSAAHVANTPLAVIEWDRDFRLTRWTGSAEAVFGWAADEVLGLSFHDFPLVHPDDADRVGEVCRRLQSGQERRNVVFNRNLHKSGRVLTCEWHNSVLFDAAGGTRSILSLAHDRTPAAEAQAAVARSEARLRDALRHANMLGWEHDLTTGVTHYSGDRSAFYGAEDDDEPTLNVVYPADRERVRAAIECAAATGRPLAVEYRGLDRTTDGRPREFLARGHVEANADGRPARAVGVTAEVTDQVRAAEDRAALARALLDARRQAVPPQTAHTLNNALAVALASLQAASDVLADHPATEPVRAAAAACGRMADALRGPATAAEPTGWRASGKVLVADDEPNTRELVATLLEDVGFEVVRAADGLSALAAFEADPTGYRLVATDILMPGLEGDSLVARLRDLRPGLPAVLMTGFLTRPVAPDVLRAPATRLLTKPFRVEHMLAAAQAVCGTGVTASAPQP